MKMKHQSAPVSRRPDQVLDLAIVVPQLTEHGGAEIFLIECLKHWQRRARVTLYTTGYDQELLSSYGVHDRDIDIVRLSGFDGKDLLSDILVLPGVWENEIGRHDVYFCFLYPAHFVRRRPAVSMVSEPLRMLYDLRFQSSPEAGDTTSFHIYPRMDYNHEPDSRANALFSVLEEADRHLEFDGLVTMSEAMNDYLEAVYGRRADQVIYPGVHLADEIYPQPAEPSAIFVGRLWRHKRVDLIIEALSMVAAGRLVVVGDGPELQNLKDLSERLGVEERVEFRGVVEREHLVRLYGGATCAVYVPVNEPLGMVPLEAAAVGRPSIVCRSGGFSEILDESCAVYVNPDAGSIAVAMEALFDSPREAARIGRLARSRVAGLSWHDTADRLFQSFRNAAENPAGYDDHDNPPQVGAHYYAWYDSESLRHWNDSPVHGTVLDPPSAGLYSSNCRSTIARHLDLAQRAGLEFLVVNWQVGPAGLDQTELEATRKLIEMIQERGDAIRISILLAVETDDFSHLEQALATIASELSGQPAYQRHRGRPLIWYLLSNELPGQIYHRYNRFVELNRPFARIAAGAVPYHARLPAVLEWFFDGWILYSPLQAGDGSDPEGIWMRNYDDFNRARSGGGIRAFSLCPGYDDRGLAYRLRDTVPRRCIQRARGGVYANMMRTAMSLSPSPELVVITSFNEFHENTHIEPSERYDDRYIRATRRFVESLKSVNSRAAINAG